MEKVSIILPTYNEKENILELISRIKSVMKGYKFEIIVVDDDSPDKTWKSASGISSVNVIRRIGKKGIAGAINEGIQHAKGDYIIWMDADLSHPPENIPELLKELKVYSDIAICSRYAKDGKDARAFIRRFTSRLFNIYASIILGHNIKDYDSGYIAVKKKVFRSIKFPAYGHGEYFIEFVYKASKRNFIISEIGFTNIDRAAGDSKTADSFFSLLNRGIQYGLKILKLRCTIYDTTKAKI